MATPAQLTSQQSTLDSYKVRDPVSATHGARWISQLTHLLARQVHRVCSCRTQQLSARTANAKSLKIAYRKSRGAKLVIVRVEMYHDNTVIFSGLDIAEGNRATLLLTLPSGASLVARDDEVFDGAHNLTLPSFYTTNRIAYETLLDVTGCSTTTTSDMTVTIAGVGAETHIGISTVTVYEVPLGALLPESGDYGLAYAWADPRNFLETGDLDGPRGFYSLLRLEQSAAIEQRWMWQIFGYEDSAPSPTGDTWLRTGTTMGAIDWRGRVSTATQRFRARSRALYGTSAGMVCTLRARYYSANGGKLRLVVTPIGGAPTNIDLTLPISAAWTTATVSITLPASGTDQEFTIEPQLQDNDAAGVTYLSQISIIQEESA